MKDDVTLIKGSHTIKTGFTYDRQQANGFGQQDYGGRAGFSFLQTGVPGQTNFATAGGSPFASFLLGYAHSGRTETIRFLQQVYPYYGFYLQDDWRMSGKFVLNYGVRYESHSRRSRAAINTPSSTQRNRIRLQTAIRALSSLRATGRGARGSEA